jgi:hypothetical protein
MLNDHIGYIMPISFLPGIANNINWGDIEGIITDQSDLINELNSKAASDHNHDNSYSPLSHLSDINNPHNVSKAQVGLSNVTNDAQIKRSAGDFSSFTEKSSPHDNDIIIIEDSEDSYNKKKIKIANIPASSGGSSIVEIKYKSADELHSGNIPSEDSHLSIYVEANKKYAIQLFLQANNGNGAGRRLQFKWSVPNGASGYHWGCGTNSDGSATSLQISGNRQSLTTAEYYNMNSASNNKNQLIFAQAYIETGDNAGTVTLLWAGDDASTSDFKLYKGSHITIWKV